MKKKVIGIFICLIILFLQVSCQTKPNYIPISEKDISQIKLWGWENGKWEDGRTLSKAESATIIKWVNIVKSIGTIKLLSDMKPPNSEITVYLLNQKIIQIFIWGDNLVMSYSGSNAVESLKVKQKDLKKYLNERLKQYS
jgi:hypothetical protein